MRTNKQILTQVKPEIRSTQPKRHVGILGGTFNPIHTGHLVIAEQVFQQLHLNKVLFLPDNIPPHRGVQKTKPIGGNERIEMIKLAIEDNLHFDLDLTDVNRGGVSYTYETVKILKQLNPNTEFYFIIGGDMVENLPKWSHIDELVQMIHFVGVCRKGFEKSSKYPILWVNTPELEISSSMIRESVREGRSIKYLVPERVEDYILDKGLYR
ncbi:nicotinate-nucleotide adenylyltransferase [Companilactobacillus sp.]|jgi:nicotinate-nucleotide adenylyltransferase|uniref:nicotinate-nucleotide adenylyltransferase n=1 Tax=Companilactobacillus sp. TaxID=2767905 RepID=UPI0025C1B5D1|nr:nicotinate-nucleotide adenylyltransferase [Companilactobacillus sp.]MCH4007988.1 nicotinate-nucleotide adenylyltransferase [Companilactobacillus sp.]MCH4051833.1 nicotinate-nucleotide adenylyltransferase [Companilactobacillus sp.]MCH4075931.1 nicotinate-nucleotide adenylyltransferase [Companilactobacillus sp.]MCH4124506.1 nicotinate-nucleotide adenylyltransferase [Companilactobacillus sp.]MCH4132531.1 nicotinate-nucleotide adenylyltransferase [Companilactobacillus sp.]